MTECVDNSSSFQEEFSSTARQGQEENSHPFAKDLTMEIMPNPFANQAKIIFDLPKATTLTLQVYTISGQLVETIYQQQRQEAGQFSITYSPKTPMNGMYYFVMKTDSQMLNKRVIIVE